MGRQYDLVGNLTRLTYPDNYYVVYSYDAVNELTGLTDSNSVTLLELMYNNLGQISNVTRASGPSETRGYGSDLRLSSQAYSFSDTSKNVIFSYTFNLAGQPMTMISNNSAYDGTTSPSATSYATDGQNRYTTVGTHTMSYNGRSDLTNDGSNTFIFDGLNRLITLNGTTFSYDALDRRYRSVSGSNNNRLVYSGQQAVASYDVSGNIINRYVPDLPLDRTLLWYPGTSTTVSGANWLVTNAFGSVVAGAFSGTAETTTYDGFGVSGSSGLSAHNGNLGFKGMLSTGSAGFYNARARTYNASQGRFLQPDPAGYADGMNYYSFVHNDPISNSDPTGLICGQPPAVPDPTLLGQTNLQDPVQPTGPDIVVQAPCTPPEPLIVPSPNYQPTPNISPPTIPNLTLPRPLYFAHGEPQFLPCSTLGSLECDACINSFLQNTYGNLGGFLADTFNVQQSIPGISGKSVTDTVYLDLELVGLKQGVPRATIGISRAFNMWTTPSWGEIGGAAALTALDIVGAATVPFASTALFHARLACGG